MAKRVISTSEWFKAKRQGYTHVSAEGVRYLLVIDRETQGTVLERVVVIPDKPALRGEE